ncbi:MAG: tetratricopeptide repeat protein, partial [Polyangiaceae bacterium]|nr:tetratricopeptide repeat protein [Polyangiaceae bacterium]
AVRAAPEDPMPRVNLGLLLLARGEVDPARIELRRALPHAEGDAAMLQAIGNGLRRAGDAELALRALEGAVEAEDPKTPALRSELALAQYAAGQRDAAETTLRAVIGDAPTYATAHYLLGTMLVERGATAEGHRHLRRVIELEPNGPHAQRARAQLETRPR